MEEVEDKLPLLPLRGMLVFPGMIINLDVGRDRSLRAVNAAMRTGRKILLVTQRRAEEPNPGEKDLYSCGVVAEIKQLLKLPDGTLRLMVEGLERADIARVQDLPDGFWLGVFNGVDVRPGA